MGKDLLQYKGMKRILAVLTVLTCMQGAAIIMQAEWLAEAVTRLFNGERVGSLFPSSHLIYRRFFISTCCYPCQAKADI